MTAEEYFDKGNDFYDKGDFKNAIENYTKAIEINPNYADAYFNRGSAKSNLGKYQAAIEDYTKAIEINPNYAEAYFNRGNAKYDLDNINEAIQDYCTALYLIKTSKTKSKSDRNKSMLWNICSKLVLYPQNIVYAYENTDFQLNTVLETACVETFNFYLYVEYLKKQNIDERTLMSFQAIVYYYLGGNVPAYRIYDRLDDDTTPLTAQQLFYFSQAANEINWESETILNDAISKLSNRNNLSDEDKYYLGHLYLLANNEALAKQQFEMSENFCFSKIMNACLSDSETNSDFSEMTTHWNLSGSIHIQEHDLSQFNDYFHLRECVSYKDLALPKNIDFEQLFWKAFTLDKKSVNDIYESFDKNKSDKIKKELISQLQKIQNGYNSNVVAIFTNTINENSTALRTGLNQFKEDINQFQNTLEKELALKICEKKIDPQQLIINLVYAFIAGEIDTEQYIDLMYYFRYKQCERYNMALTQLFTNVLTLIPKLDTVFNAINIVISYYELVGQDNNANSINLPTNVQSDYLLFKANDWKQILVDYNAKYQQTEDENIKTVKLTDFIPVYI